MMWILLQFKKKKLRERKSCPLNQGIPIIQVAPTLSIQTAYREKEGWKNIDSTFHQEHCLKEAIRPA